ncbi:hypothetical protein AC578_3985 [Pseudocercospora eumusae]|uniref:F-box domain-containing protein n=1 Tax=Pseudocercospora eumusae TaxID=321146 RepID=A0A139HLU1_9PEZI|nr:hypothetical protein AC578_3985 [Pseudocercospora eumusae]
MANDVESAGARLTNTFELLERILLEIFPPKRTFTTKHIKTLLQCKQVSKAFRDTIANSPPLRRALFLDPPQVDADPEDFDDNPMLAGTCRVSHDIVVDVWLDPLAWRKKDKDWWRSLAIQPRYSLANNHRF